MREQDQKTEIREMSVLNLIMVIGIAIGLELGYLLTMSWRYCHQDVRSVYLPLIIHS